AEVGVLLAAWAVRDPLAPAPLAFRVRRAEVRLAGRPLEHWGYALSLDPTYAGILKDGYVSYHREDWFRFQVGQMKVPVSAEFLRDGGNLDTVERARFASAAATRDFGYMRDIGMLAVLSARIGKAWLGAYNGAGDNVAANAPYNSFVGRLELTPFGEALTLGGSYLYGYKKSSDAAGKTTEGTRARYGGNADLKLGKLRLGGEALSGYDNWKTNSQALGLVGQALYAVLPDQDVLVRVEGWNPDGSVTGTNSLQEWSAGLGWTYRIGGTGTRIQVNYFHDFLPRNVVDDRLLTSFALQL
ncbi:MAG: hypothetical protein FJZ01_26780, partial [Candidatus Sericytochromatia bacterium]|nr:hypothetical protein [Candidatus Tanganyikabacteria bacterium]